MDYSATPTRFVPASRRRDKPILSCNLCRKRKLKCDRQKPCKSCMERGLALSCAFSPAGTMTRGSKKEPQDVHARIDELEKLVASLIDERIASANPSSTGVSPTPMHHHVNGHDDAIGALSGPLDRLSLEDDEVTYTNNSHWSSILEGIAELRSHLNTSPPTSEGFSQFAPSNKYGPVLLFGQQLHASREEILEDLPSRDEMDRLIVSYFGSMDMAPVFMHRPSFLRAYDDFWRCPSETSTMWLGLLFSALCLGAIFEHRISTVNDIDEEGCLRSETPWDIDLFQKKAVQCMVLADYVKCPPFTLEALLAYFVTEYFLQGGHSGPWFICGIIVRIAFRMGYHRDPSNFPNISPFDAEMRRRLWCIVVQLDLMSASRAGLPRTIQKFQYDTKEPRNLWDEDFGEGSVTLPPSRPDTEYTPMMYLQTRTDVLEVFARISDLSNFSSLPPYPEIMRLDSELQQARQKICGSSIDIDNVNFDNPSLALQQIYLRRLLIKAQCILHRHYLVQARVHDQYEYSRTSCIDAALALLRYQKVLYEESRLNGRLWPCRWRINPLFGHDSLLGCTILCLELHQGRSSAATSSSLINHDRQLREKKLRAEILNALQGSYEIFVRGSGKSDGAMRIVEALNIVFAEFANELKNSITSPFSTQAGSTSAIPTTHSDTPPLEPKNDAKNTTSTSIFGAVGEDFDWAALEAEYMFPSVY